MERLFSAYLWSIGVPRFVGRVRGVAWHPVVAGGDTIWEWGECGVSQVFRVPLGLVLDPLNWKDDLGMRVW